MSKHWKSRIVGHDELDPKELKANPANWRRHPEQQRVALRSALGHIGWVQQVIVNKTTGLMVDGHARVEEALAAGEKLVPVVYVELSEQEEMAALATLDPIGTLTVRDTDMLVELMQGTELPDELTAMLEDLTTVPEMAEETFEMPDDDEYKEQYGLIIPVTTKAHQEQLIAELQGKGYTCKGIAV